MGAVNNTGMSAAGLTLKPVLPAEFSEATVCSRKGVIYVGGIIGVIKIPLLCFLLYLFVSSWDYTMNEITNSSMPGHIPSDHSNVELMFESHDDTLLRDGNIKNIHSKAALLPNIRSSLELRNLRFLFVKGDFLAEFSIPEANQFASSYLHQRKEGKWRAFKWPWMRQKQIFLLKSPSLYNQTLKHFTVQSTSVSQQITPVAEIWEVG